MDSVGRGSSVWPNPNMQILGSCLGENACKWYAVCVSLAWLVAVFCCCHCLVSASRSSLWWLVVRQCLLTWHAIVSWAGATTTNFPLPNGAIAFPSVKDDPTFKVLQANAAARGLSICTTHIP